MVDWARKNEPTARTRDQFLWDLMLLSLLYDDVFVQDEIVLCSKTLPKWFPDTESFRLLEETIESGGVSLLKRPYQRYPNELQGLAQIQPITARREHLTRFSVDNDGAPLRFTPQHLAFHNRLEAFLASRPRAHRYAGEQNKLGGDLMHEFGRLLASVLKDPIYERWLRTTYRTITPAIADDFVVFIHEPEKAIARLHQERPDHTARYTPQSGKPVFSTALAVQVAATYQAAKPLQDLIESVFARPFCQDEGADGRYGKALRDLPIDVPRNTGKVLKVETQVAVPLTLPWPGPGFSRIIATVREMNSGKRLRKAMLNLSRDLAFTYARAAWFDVADDIASLAAAKKMKKIDLQLLLMRVGEGVLWGALADLTRHPPESLEQILDPLLGGATDGALHGVYSLGGDLYSHRHTFETDELRPQLANSVDWACVPHPTVPAQPDDNGQ
jgi:hypothetical protein